MERKMLTWTTSYSGLHGINSNSMQNKIPVALRKQLWTTSFSFDVIIVIKLGEDGDCSRVFRGNQQLQKLPMISHRPDNISKTFEGYHQISNRLCGLMVTVLGSKLRGPRFDSWRCKIFCVAVGLERSPLSLVSINEQLLERDVAALVPENWD
jgi:hypothetical protein